MSTIHEHDARLAAHRPQATTVATRSRKGRTSFRKLATERWTATVGTSEFIDPIDLVASTIGVDEPALVRAADAILSRADDGMDYRLTDRPWMMGRRGEMSPQVFGGSDDRGISDATTEDPDWTFCHRHGDMTAVCGCIIPVEASTCVLENVGGSRGDNGTTVADAWPTRSVVARAGRMAARNGGPERYGLVTLRPGSKGAPGVRRQAAVIGVTERRDGALVSHLVGWADDGWFVGNGRRSTVARRRASTRAARTAARTARQTARRVAAERSAVDLEVEADPTTVAKVEALARGTSFRRNGIRVQRPKDGNGWTVAGKRYATAVAAASALQAATA